MGSTQPFGGPKQRVRRTPAGVCPSPCVLRGLPRPDPEQGRGLRKAGLYLQGSLEVHWPDPPAVRLWMRPGPLTLCLGFLYGQVGNTER